jgi:hypothetical protein
MSSDRKSAIWVGVLYIAATVFPVAALAPWSALIDGDGILVNAATHESQLITVALLNLVMVVAVAGVAFMLYPVLRRVADTGVRQGLAAWYVGTRITESGAFLVGVLATMAFLPYGAMHRRLRRDCMDVVDGLDAHEQFAPVSTNRCDLLVRRGDCGGAES